MPSGPRATAESLPLSDVEIDDRFWTPRTETNRDVTIAHQYERLKENGCLANFRRVIDGKRGGFEGPMFIDSDAYKWLEAASYELAKAADTELKGRVDEVIDLIADAQADDGYLNTYFMLEEPDARWTNLSVMHELYCAGHLIEAAVAHYSATGEERFLEVATGFADHIDDLSGERIDGVPGHEEIELALIKLYRATDDQRYLDLGRYFIDLRGRDPSPLANELANIDRIGGSNFIHHGNRTADVARDHFLDDGEYDGSYAQDHRPIREQESVEGHSVRAMYLYTAVTSLLQEVKDEELRAAMERLWTNITKKRMYVTGGIGSEHEHEGFTRDYDLPNDAAYAETCAAVGSILWNRRFFELTGDAAHANLIERTLYNGFLSGVAYRGDEFFYVNPLETAGDHHRKEWFYVACCPPNAARLLASLERYIYARSTGGTALYINQFVGSRVETELDGERVSFTQSTEYPWEGDITVTFTHEDPVEFELRMRVPEWVDSVDVSVNGDSVTSNRSDGYVRIDREWAEDDCIRVSFPLSIDAMVAHPQVRENAGRIALRRGPLIYCLEGTDHPVPVRSISIPDADAFTSDYESDLLDGITVLRGEGIAPTADSWSASLYRPTGEIEGRTVDIVAVPYFAWDNRNPGAMTVWLPSA